jgi:hypothetical protein
MASLAQRSELFDLDQLPSAAADRKSFGKASPVDALARSFADVVRDSRGDRRIAAAAKQRAKATAKKGKAHADSKAHDHKGDDKAANPNAARIPASVQKRFGAAVARADEEDDTSGADWPKSDTRRARSRRHKRRSARSTLLHILSVGRVARPAPARPDVTSHAGRLRANIRKDVSRLMRMKRYARRLGWALPSGAHVRRSRAGERGDDHPAVGEARDEEAKGGDAAGRFDKASAPLSAMRAGAAAAGADTSVTADDVFGLIDALDIVDPVSGHARRFPVNSKVRNWLGRPSRACVRPSRPVAAGRVRVWSVSAVEWRCGSICWRWSRDGPCA